MAGREASQGEGSPLANTERDAAIRWWWLWRWWKTQRGDPKDGGDVHCTMDRTRSLRGRVHRVGWQEESPVCPILYRYSHTAASLAFCQPLNLPSSSSIHGLCPGHSLCLECCLPRPFPGCPFLPLCLCLHVISLDRASLIILSLPGFHVFITLRSLKSAHVLIFSEIRLSKLLSTCLLLHMVESPVRARTPWSHLPCQHSL